MTEMIVALRTLIALLWGGTTSVGADVVNNLRYAVLMSGQGLEETDGEFYFRGLRKLGLAIIGIPIPFLIIGIFTNLPTVVALIGLIWGLFTVFFAIAGTPFALFVESLTETAKSGIVKAVEKGAVKISIESYLSFIRSILTAEMVSSLCFSVFPVYNNPKMIFVIIVAVIVLGLLSSANRWKKLVSLLAAAVIVVGIFSFVLPDSFAMMQGWRGKIDNIVAPAIDPGNSLVPIGGLMETPEQRAKYAAAVKKDNPIPPDPPKANVPSFIPDPEDTLRFDFNDEKVLFDPVKHERRKDIVTNGSYSPIVVIPWGMNWHLETLDTTDVWFKDGSHMKIYPGMKPVDIGRKVAIFRVRSNYPVTVWIDRVYNS